MSHCVFKPSQLQRLTEGRQELRTTGSCDGPCCDASVMTSASSSGWQEMATTGSCDDLCCGASVTKSTLSSRWQEMAATGCCDDLCCDASVTKSTSLPDAWVSRCNPVTCHRVTRYTLQSVTGSQPPPPPSPRLRLPTESNGKTA